jgi:hypothetical protein
VTRELKLLIMRTEPGGKSSKIPETRPAVLCLIDIAQPL